MKTAGIICEYNPFHLGHARQLSLLRQQLGEECRIVCVMSGNYVQRGLPAMWNKYDRARAAAACGADLVLELPVTGVLQSAEGFAQTGVEILTRLGCVDVLCFGAECGDAAALNQLAAALDEPVCMQRLRDGLKQGLPYAAARQAALEDQDNLLRQPNNILGLEYCRAIRKLGSSLTPLAIQRNGDYHAAAADIQAPSAAAVRNLFPDGHWTAYVPEAAANILQGAPWYDLSYGERAVLARLRSLDDDAWEHCAHGSEGLWSKARQAARSQPDLESVIHAIKSKRYPRSRIQRLLLCAYLGIDTQDLNRPLPYIRILASTQTGRTILREARKKSDLSLINPGQTLRNHVYWPLERRCADLFTLFAAPNYPTLCQTEQAARLCIQQD